MITYERFVPLSELDSALALTVEHVRAHLSSVADADDDPETNADDVYVECQDVEGGVMVRGKLDAEPDAPYLKGDYNPFDGVPAELLALIEDDEVAQ